jgi:Zn finger protein HypA/HybF involved in hydrogenase expression
MNARPILCPRCHSKNIRLVEYASHSIVYEPKDMVGFQQTGDIEKVVLKCRACNHEHTLRGCRGVDEDLKTRLAANAQA